MDDEIRGDLAGPPPINNVVTIYIIIKSNSLSTSSNFCFSPDSKNNEGIENSKKTIDVITHYYNEKFIFFNVLNVESWFCKNKELK